MGCANCLETAAVPPSLGLWREITLDTSSCRFYVGDGLLSLVVLNERSASAGISPVMVEMWNACFRAGEVVLRMSATCMDDVKSAGNQSTISVELKN